MRKIKNLSHYFLKQNSAIFKEEPGHNIYEKKYLTNKHPYTEMYLKMSQSKPIINN